MKEFARFQLPAILYALLIFVGSSLHNIPSPDLGITWFDKVEHFAEYFVFIVLAIRALHHPPVALQGKSLYMLVILICILYAASDEFHQLYVPGREADAADFLADSLGTISGAIFYITAEAIIRKRGRKL